MRVLEASTGLFGQRLLNCSSEIRHTDVPVSTSISTLIPSIFMGTLMGGGLSLFHLPKVANLLSLLTVHVFLFSQKSVCYFLGPCSLGALGHTLPKCPFWWQFQHIFSLGCRSCPNGLGSHIDDSSVHMVYLVSDLLVPP